MSAPKICDACRWHVHAPEKDCKRIAAGAGGHAMRCLECGKWYWLEPLKEAK